MRLTRATRPPPRLRCGSCPATQAAAWGARFSPPTAARASPYPPARRSATCTRSTQADRCPYSSCRAMRRARRRTLRYLPLNSRYVMRGCGELRISRLFKAASGIKAKKWRTSACRYSRRAERISRIDRSVRLRSRARAPAGRPHQRRAEHRAGRLAARLGRGGAETAGGARRTMHDAGGGDADASLRRPQAAEARPSARFRRRPAGRGRGVV